ncbi:MAG: hypothetical protein RLZZ444_1190 [Pseudomonadota bacterium]|jgi:hypothetical protein
MKQRVLRAVPTATFELFSRIVGDERAVDELRRSVALTSSPTVEASAAGQAWIARHMGLAAHAAQKPMIYFRSAESLGRNASSRRV